jgi:hypothetical protein
MDERLKLMEPEEIEIPEDELILAAIEGLEEEPEPDEDEIDIITDEDEEELVQEVAAELGAENLEELEFVRRFIRGFRRPFRRILRRRWRRLPRRRMIRRIARGIGRGIIKRTLPQVAKAIGGIMKGEARFYYHGKTLKSGNMNFFNDTDESTNLRTAGRLSTSKTVIVQRIGVWFGEPYPDTTQLSDIVNAIKSGKLVFYRGNDVIFEAPLSFIADFNVRNAVATTATDTTIKDYVITNSRLERGFLPVKNLVFKPDQTIKVEVQGLSGLSANPNVKIYIGLLGVEQ